MPAEQQDTLLQNMSLHDRVEFLRHQGFTLPDRMLQLGRIASNSPETRRFFEAHSESNTRMV